MQIIANRKIWFSFSGILIIIATSALALWGLKPGIDFTGGSLLELEFSSGTLPDPAAIKSVFADAGVAEPLIQPSGGATAVLRFATVTETEHQRLLDALAEKFEGMREARFDSIGPAIGRELFTKSLVAILAVTLMVLIYLTWAFRKVSRPVPAWVYGGIVVATFLHDTIIPLGLFAWLGHFRGVEIGSPFIAAVLIILAYSINDTIVVFDRVRENLPRLRAPFAEIVEASVHQTITRSINTSLTTVAVLTAIYFFGGTSLQVFSLALIVGIALGTYSSIFIAAPLLISWYNWKKK